jgi:hypothetical protein
MWGTGLALVARHAASQPLLVALIATPLCAFLSPSGAAAPLQSACALALTLLEVARLCESAEELVLSAVAVALLLLTPHPTPPLTLVLPLASACVLVASASFRQSATDDLTRALLALDLAAAYVGDVWQLGLLLAPLVASQTLMQGPVAVARWGLLPALLLGAHAHARALRRPSSLYAIVAATVLALCALGDPLLELALLALHAGARWLAPTARHDRRHY